MSLLASLLTICPRPTRVLAPRSPSGPRPCCARREPWLGWTRSPRGWPPGSGPSAPRSTRRTRWCSRRTTGVAAAAGVSAYPTEVDRRDARRAGEGRGHRCRDDQDPGDDARRGRRRRRAPDRRSAVRAGDGRGAFRRGRPGGTSMQSREPRPRICSSSARWGSATRPPPRPWPRPCTTSRRPSGADAGPDSTTTGWRARSKRWRRAAPACAR